MAHSGSTSLYSLNVLVWHIYRERETEKKERERERERERGGQTVP